MNYQILALDLDGTLTNSSKEISEPTLKALIEIQEQGKKVVLASGRPTNGVAPLAEQLRLGDYGSYILSFNGGPDQRNHIQQDAPDGLRQAHIRHGLGI